MTTKPFRLWIDGQCLQTSSRLRGIGRYVTELVRAIAETQPGVELLISLNGAFPDTALQARDAITALAPSATVHVWHGTARHGEAVEGYSDERRLSEIAIAHHVNCLRPDIALSASPFEGLMDVAVPLLPGRGSRSPVASIFYDAIPYRFADVYLPSSVYRSAYERRLRSYSQFDDNLCISEFSRSELNDIHPGAAAASIFAGISKEFHAAESRTTGRALVDGPYVLYVGALDWRKNLSTLVDAFSHLSGAATLGEMKLVLAGDGPSQVMDELARRWTRLGLPPERLISLGHIPDDELPALLKNSSALVQPSRMEGFGLTALEGIHCGVPVAAARAGALPEVVSPDEWLFNPDSAEDLARVLRTILSDKARASALVGEALAHAARYTWEHSAALAVGRLADIVNGPTVQSDLPELRRAAANLVSTERLRTADSARAMALSEPWGAPRRLLIDATSTVRVDHKTGIQRVVKNVASGLALRAGARGVQREVIFCDDGSGWTAVDPLTLTKRRGATRSITIGRDTLLMLDSSWEFHHLHRHYLRSCRLLGGEVVSCLYDTVPLTSPAFCAEGMPHLFADWFNTALQLSTGFVCISRTVADELHALLEAIAFPRPMKIGYWHLGADFADLEDEPTGPTAAAAPSFLMVGTLEPRKGYAVSLDAFEALWAEGVDAELVIVGKPGWGVDGLIARIRSHPESGRRLKWHHDLSDPELSTLYRECVALVSTSLAEGFGLPLVEARHHAKPVIASDIPVFREVTEGAPARFFEPGSAPSLAAAVRGFLARSGEAIEGGSWPTWDDSVLQLEEVLLGDKWYRSYVPSRPRHFGPPDEIGRIAMTSPLPPAQRAYQLRLLDGPSAVEGGRMLKFIVAVTNRSSVAWSSRGSVDGSLGVTLGYHVLDADGAPLQHENPRTAIPFVHPPGATLNLALLVPSDWVARGAGFIDIELVQEGVAWFGSPLRVAIGDAGDRQSASAISRPD